MNTTNLGNAAGLGLLTVAMTGCMLDLDLNDGEYDEIVTVESGSTELRNATNTTGYAPVVRIENSSGGTCTATAIADDVLVTAVHCIKSGNTVRDYVKVRKAHGANSDSQGAYSSYFILSADLYDNFNVKSSGNGSGYYKRDIAFIKFGAGTFDSYYSLDSISADLDGQTVRLVGFGGNDTKSYGDDVVTDTVWLGEYAYVKTNNANGVANTENGDSGGPILLSNGSSYKVAGVLYGSGSNGSSTYSLHSVITSDVWDHVYPVLTDYLPTYCVENYQHANRGGWSMSFCIRTGINNVFNADSFSDTFKIDSHWKYGHWNDELSSMTLPSNTILTVYQHSGQGGDALTFQTVLPFGNGSIVNALGDYGFNDRISSFRISRTSSGTNKDWYLEITRHGKCIDLDGGNTSNGANIQQWSCGNGNSNQIFRLSQVGSYYQIKHAASGKCLDVKGYGTSNGSTIHLWSCHGGDNQLFSLSSNSSTSDVRDFKIVGKQSGKCVDLSGGSSSNGADIQIWSCSSSNANQNFALHREW